MKQLTRVLIGSFCLAAAAGCAKEDNSKPTGPKEYQVEYRISSPSATTANFVLYGNETGGNTQLSNVALPATYTFKRTMKYGDAVNVLANLNTNSATAEITTVILLDGQEKKRETGRGNNAQANTVFVIGQ
ncbi:MmpS family transport accessory protein [Solirubrum puertoriconensis]|uniref:Lipoprotein n=1 Tax=Solirubrum puertoriconensis TaxID=1751427 RepID=A0A9X0L466_SOLP1|nr:MmpS family transport accessory protein [Solirubrum puertoriconensis]KUG07270.1 hypothetical protein ASU33_12960 [Solirubrum puertoriconensis]